jgi:hypothetical protein
MADQPNIDLTVRFELADYLRFNHWYYFRAWPMRVMMGIAGMALIFGLCGLAVWPHELARLEVLPFLFFLPIVFFILYPAALYFGAKRSLATHRALQEPIAYRFSADGIELKALTSSSQMSWVNVYQACETKHDFIILISRNQAYVIPKRCFNDAEQQSAFRSLLRNQLEGRATLLPAATTPTS